MATATRTQDKSKTQDKPKTPDKAKTPDALAGLDLTFAPTDVPESLRSSAAPNPFDGIVKELADAFKAYLKDNDGKEPPREGNARSFTVPGPQNTDTNEALKQAMRKLNAAGKGQDVSVAKRASENKVNGRTVTSVVFWVRPKITRKTAASASAAAPAA